MRERENTSSHIFHLCDWDTQYSVYKSFLTRLKLERLLLPLYNKTAKLLEH